MIPPSKRNWKWRKWKWKQWKWKKWKWKKWKWKMWKSKMWKSKKWKWENGSGNGNGISRTARVKLISTSMGSSIN